VLIREYEQVCALTPEEARAECEAEKKYMDSQRKIDPEKVESLIKSLDNRGAWVTDIVIRNYDDPNLSITTIRGINTGNFNRNIYTLMFYIMSLKMKQ